MFRERVEPALKEYLEVQLSERRANILAEALDAHLEWTYGYYEQIDDPSRLNGAATLRSFRTDLLKQHRPLRVMSDLADSARHRDRPRNPPRVVKSSTAAYYVEAGVLHVQGFKSPFKSEATQAVEFWRNWRD